MTFLSQLRQLPTVGKEVQTQKNIANKSYL
jgi:hypothetical protein